MGFWVRGGGTRSRKGGPGAAGGRSGQTVRWRSISSTMLRVFTSSA